MENGSYVFKGIRYGESTSGANRFMPPKRPEKWAGIRDAISWGASAPQLLTPQNTDPFYAWYSAIQPTSEDCLFLNVVTPGLNDGKRPVMVWIHGGGWRELSGTAPGFAGTTLARTQDVVVVTLNHRLNAFGHLRLDGEDERFADSGNVGLLDIVLALNWVRENAAAFGGDSNNVTLFGESGGASKIAAILGMRAAKGLFHKAIMQSSGGGLQLASGEEAAREAATLAKALRRSKLSGDELQNIPMEDLLAATSGRTFRGMIDGRNFAEDLYGWEGPSASTQVPVMVGCTNTETTYHLRADPTNFTLLHSDVRQRLARFLDLEGTRVDAIIDAYRTFYPDYGPSDILIMITSDYMFKRTAFRLATLHAAADVAPVYAYLFDRETPIDGGRMRSPHTSEVPFIFGTTSAAEAHVGSGSDIQPMTECMMATWASFARHGDPANPTVPEWTPYNESDRRTMVLNVESELVVDPGGQARAALDELPYYGYSHSIGAFVNT